MPISSEAVGWRKEQTIALMAMLSFTIVGCASAPVPAPV